MMIYSLLLLSSSCCLFFFYYLFKRSFFIVLYGEQKTIKCSLLHYTAALFRPFGITHDFYK